VASNCFNPSTSTANSRDNVYRGAQQTFEEFEALSLEDGEPNASEVLV